MTISNPTQTFHRFPEAAIALRKLSSRFLNQLGALVVGELIFRSIRCHRHQSLRRSQVGIKVLGIAKTSQNFEKTNSLLLILRRPLRAGGGLLSLVLDVAEFDREFAFGSAPTDEDDHPDRAQQGCCALNVEEKGPPHCHSRKVSRNPGSHAGDDGCRRRDEDQKPFELLTASRHSAYRSLSATQYVWTNRPGGRAPRRRGSGRLVGFGVRLLMSLGTTVGDDGNGAIEDLAILTREVSLSLVHRST